VVAVKAEDGETGRGVLGGRKLFVGVSGDAVFRAEEGYDLHAGGMGEDVDRGSFLVVKPSVIGD
jgi:hypothetical protein